MTHDVGLRISWTLRPEVSQLKENWQQKRANMQDVCAACHHQEFVAGHYYQMDGVIRLYDEKFAKPAGAIMEMIRERGLLENPSAFSNAVEWHFMDTPRFCGTACHRVMNPEWESYQRLPHARVRCVDCHVGEGAGALIDAKLSGLRQIVSATFNLYDRPIPTPVHNLRPARETCEKCHWPEEFYGERIKVVTRHAHDEASTPSYTTLALRVGSGVSQEHGRIHWPIAAQSSVRHQAATPDRRRMAWVEVQSAGGEVRRFTRRGAGDPRASGEPRTLDCIDCHNRATHIYEDPESTRGSSSRKARMSGPAKPPSMRTGMRAFGNACRR